VNRVLADDGGKHAAARPDEIAYGQQRAADAAIDRRVDVGVAQFQLRPLQLRLQLCEVSAGLVAARDGVFQPRLRRDIALRQRQLPLIFLPGAGERGLRRLECALRVGDGGQIRGFFDDEQQVALLHVRAFLKQALLKKAVDAGAQFHLVHGLHTGGERDGCAKFLGDDLEDGDGRRWQGLLLRGCLRSRFTAGQHSRGKQRNNGAKPLQYLRHVGYPPFATPKKCIQYSYVAAQAAMCRRGKPCERCCFSVTRFPASPLLKCHCSACIFCFTRPIAMRRLKRFSE
jgi:hypothetical protein